jgi:crotonobetainyl-CoA:carnitine CoA-transferase CaiB-like acyl-CoA transferase
VNPRSIYAQGSGFGPRGPRATRPARDVLGQAISGIMSVTGMPDDPPLPAGTLIGDQGSAIQLAMGVLAALVHRERTGQGQRVDVSIYGALLGLQTWEVTQYALTKRLKRAGRTHVFVGGAWGSFKTKDGYLCLAGIGEDRWPRFTRIVPGLDEDPRFTTLELRQKNEPELIAHLDRAFPQRSTAEWLQDLEAADILCAPVHTYDDVLADEQSNANGYVQTMQHPLLGEIKAVGPVIGLSETPLAVQGSEPELGAHTEEILLELGYTWQQIEQLRNCQAI